IAGPQSAGITWNTDENATSQVDFGGTASYGSTQSDAAMVQSHAVLLTGLACAASYNYRVTSVDAAGVSRQSGNFTFATPRCPASSIVLSDNFDANSLNTSIWTWMDPAGDSYLAFNGSTAQLTVPSRSAHDPWLQTGNASARIIQPIVDTNFDVAAKFVSGLNWGTTGQGILVEQDPFHYLLFELRLDGTAASVWAGGRAGAVETVLLNSPLPGIAPMWLRVARSLGTWS